MKYSISLLAGIILFALTPLASAEDVPAESLDSLLAKAKETWAQQQNEEAQKLFESAAALYPDEAEAHMRLAGFHLIQQNYRLCIDLYQKVIGMQNDNAHAFIGMGVSYLHLQNRALAKAAFTEAARLLPEKKAELDKLLANFPEQ